MFDRPAGIAAARKVLEAAPVMEVAGAREPVVKLNELVDTVLAAVNPDALIIPAYDADLAQNARHRLSLDFEGQPGSGAHMSVTAHPGAVVIGVYAGPASDRKLLASGPTAVDAAWHLALALASAAIESKRLGEEGQGDRSGE